MALTLIIKQIPGGPAGSPNHHPSFEQTAVTLWHQAGKTHKYTQRGRKTEGIKKKMDLRCKTQPGATQ